MSLVGTLQAVDVVSIEAPVEGTVETLEVEPGQEVFAGQLLATIRSSQLEAERDLAGAEMERAQSRLNSLETAMLSARLEAVRARAAAAQAKDNRDRAEKQYRRQEFLHKEGAAPRLAAEKAREEYESAEKEFSSLDEIARQAEERVSELLKQLDAAKAVLNERTKALEEANQNVAAGDVVASLDGLVIAVGAQPGDKVGPETKNFIQVAASLARMEAVLSPEPPVLQAARPGQAARVSLAEVPGEGVEGRVKEVKDGQVIVEFMNPSPAVRPGLTAHVTIQLK